MLLEDIEVTADFFKPLIPLCNGRPRCEMFLTTWRNFMNKLPDDSADCWKPRILEVVVPDRDQTKESFIYSARVATSVVVWFGTNSGHEFMKGLTQRLHKSGGRSEALSAWAIENAIAMGVDGNGGRTLHSIVQDRNISTGTRPLPLTEVENDTAETLMTWLTTSDGRKLLSLLSRTSKRFLAYEHARQEALVRKMKS